MSLDRVKGCFAGLAIGDALGAPVEFRSFEQIGKKFGKEGVTDFAPWGRFPAGSYTDDTQMSLATARGILGAFDAWKKPKQTDVIACVYQEYLRWVETQSDPRECRVPGTTCLGALGSGRMGTIEKPFNNSKGCGGVMRTAPVGLLFSGREAFKIGAACAAITHGHPSGYLPAGIISELVYYLIEGKSVRGGMDSSLETLASYKGHEELRAAMDHALELAHDDMTAEESIPLIGEGWTGEEALAISLFCALRFEHDFRAGVLAAVNHSGDSDSTGSIAGAVLGARLGIEAIPKDWIKRVENSQYIIETAEALYRLREKARGKAAG